MMKTIDRRHAVPAFCFVVVTAYAVYAHRCKATL